MSDINGLPTDSVILCIECESIEYKIENLTFLKKDKCDIAIIDNSDNITSLINIMLTNNRFKSKFFMREWFMEENELIDFLKNFKIISASYPENISPFPGSIKTIIRNDKIDKILK